MRRAVSLFVLLTFAFAGLAQDPTGAPSTRAERDRAVKVSKQLESDPLNPQLRQDRLWLLGWIQAVPDISVNVCVDPAQAKSNYRYTRELVQQKLFSSAAYIIETSARSRNDLSVEAAGVEGALKAYQAILKKYPDAHSPYWDRLLKKQQDGTLHDYVSNYMETSCGSEQVQT
jgi:hypothetical protein